MERARGQLLLEPRWRDPEATPYEILGVEPGAPSEAIHRAYLNLVSYCHPDRFPDVPHLQAQAEFVTKRINGAHRVLSQHPDACTRASRRIRTRSSDASVQAPRLDLGEFPSTSAGRIMVVVAMAGSVLVAIFLTVLLVLLLD